MLLTGDEGKKIGKNNTNVRVRVHQLVKEN